MKTVGITFFGVLLLLACIGCQVDQNDAELNGFITQEKYFWSDSNNIPVCWYGLESGDKDLPVEYYEDVENYVSDQMKMAGLQMSGCHFKHWI